MKVTGRLNVANVAKVKVLKIKRRRGLFRPSVRVLMEMQGKSSREILLYEGDALDINLDLDLV